jgi:hypothetical protein
VIEGRDDIREPIVALTFDDGPSEWTGPILQHLADHGGHGTFFALGCLAADEQRSPTLRRVVESGSEVRPPDEAAELSRPTREATVEAVGVILEAMTARGLRSVTISELLAAD